MDKILLVGPSKRVKEKNIDYYNDYRSKNFQIVSYTGSITYLYRIKFIPDYFSFFDPSTIYDNRGLISSNPEYFGQIKLLGIDMYANNLEKYKQYGYSSLMKHLPGNDLYSEYLQDLFNMFHSSNLFKNPDIAAAKKPNDIYNFNTNLTIFSAFLKGNIDKLFAFLFPLVFFRYKNIEHIHCIGFGDFGHRRCGGSSLGYSQYQKTAKVLSPTIKKYIEDRGIQLTFEHIKRNFFYDILKNKPTRK